jgi:hypothetical protein
VKFNKTSANLKYTNPTAALKFQGYSSEEIRRSKSVAYPKQE